MCILLVVALEIKICIHMLLEFNINLYFYHFSDNLKSLNAVSIYLLLLFILCFAINFAYNFNTTGHNILFVQHNLPFLIGSPFPLLVIPTCNPVFFSGLIFPSQRELSLTSTLVQDC